MDPLAHSLSFSPRGWNLLQPLWDPDQTYCTHSLSQTPLENIWLGSDLKHKIRQLNLQTSSIYGLRNLHTYSTAQETSSKPLHSWPLIHTGLLPWQPQCLAIQSINLICQTVFKNNRYIKDTSEQRKIYNKGQSLRSINHFNIHFYQCKTCELQEQLKVKCLGGRILTCAAFKWIIKTFSHSFLAKL